MSRRRRLLLTVALCACRKEEPFRIVHVVDTSLPASIEAAEAEGAKHPRADSPWYRIPAFRNSTTPGTAARKCVSADSGRDMRSGEIVAGDFQIVATRGVKSYWKALHHPFGGGEPMTIRATRLDSVAESTRAEYRMTGGYPWDKFHQAAPRMATRGRWMLVATKGPDWGCFILTRRVESS
jgi:hypothetical protein